MAAAMQRATRWRRALLDCNNNDDDLHDLPQRTHFHIRLGALAFQLQL
jgi:hypothetical protein